MTIQPIFIFSLPRSGSTLIQKILATNEKIATVSEPWILLPYLYTLKELGSYTEYGHKTMALAIKDFCDNFPNGQEDYLTELRCFILNLYTKAASKDAQYFLDKTPRYHLVVEDIIRLFPEGKFVLLWRNPLAIIASIMETFSLGKWNLYRYKVDLFDGLKNLVNTYEKFADKLCVLHYEDLVSHPETELQRLATHLNIEFEPELLSHFSSTHLKGQMGDKIGEKKYQSVSKEPLEKWKYTLSNPIRKAWCQRYLKWIGRERLALMKYDLDELLVELDAMPLTWNLINSDLIRIIYGIGYCTLEPQLIKHKLQVLPTWEQVYGHI